ncbi:MAG: MBL fold metallo-hydrolase [Actinomycetes bacterium]
MTTRVHILGSGTPTPTPERFGSAFAVEVDGQTLMVDCGPAATWKLVKAGLSPTAVTNVFFTHHHFDHDVDYPCFLLTRWDQDIAESPLHVYGPPPTERLTEQLIGPDGAFAHDYNARINWPVSQRVFANRGGTLPRKPPLVHAHDIEAGDTHEAGEWTMRTARALHVQPYLDSVAYRLDTAAGSVVFTGDTEPCESVRDLAEGADVMLCMAWDTTAQMADTGEADGCCGAESAARMAAEAGVGKLVLVHTGPRISAPGHTEEAISEVKEFFDGEVVFAEEIMSVDL